MRRAAPALAALALAAAGCADPRAVADAGQPTCTRCHGSDGDPAPPVSLRGATSTDARGVGAHRLHLRDTEIRLALACDECHAVPATVSSPGHLGPPLLVWGALAASRGSQPAFDPAQARCSGVWCHGGNPAIRGGTAPAPTWTYAVEPEYAGPLDQVCVSCHGWPPPAPHPQLTSCGGCHGTTVTSDGRIDVAGGRHVNGRPDFGGPGGGSLACDACHGYPPASGAHLVHFGWTAGADHGGYGDVRVLQDYVAAGLVPADFPSFAFGCGNCHPLEAASHMDGCVEVALAGAGAPLGSVKARNPAAAAYSGAAGGACAPPATGTCSSVYCHSSGQAEDAAAGTPLFVATPGWSSGAALGCASCHANPPRYPSGGPGAATANSHLGRAFDDYAYGHFGGLPGVWHPGGTFGSKHGQGEWPAPNDAAPITCQTCHFETVDPANVGPSGFYYLDTSGDYLLAGAVTHYDCLACHSAGSAVAPTGTGRALPLRHVNGVRDVTFDPRDALPAIPWLPAAPFTPTLPIWVTNASPLVDPLPPGATYAPPAMPVPSPGPYAQRTMSVGLGIAGYDPATKTCTSVACHLAETSVAWGGAPVDYSDPCKRCHGL
jgi:predicted CxxxxCH...CXXCH cytochrome family protein